MVSVATDWVGIHTDISNRPATQAHTAPVQPKIQTHCYNQHGRSALEVITEGNSRGTQGEMINRGKDFEPSTTAFNVMPDARHYYGGNHYDNAMMIT